jgi:hypothetical protein
MAGFSIRSTIGQLPESASDLIPAIPERNHRNSQVFTADAGDRVLISCQVAAFT